MRVVADEGEGGESGESVEGGEGRVVGMGGEGGLGGEQGVTKRCRLSWMTISPNAGKGGSCGVSANEYSCTQEPK
jgi:hypothetical protein